MNIVVTDLEGRIGAAIFSYEECENVEQVQEEIRKAGGEEKIIGFLQFPEDDDLGKLLAALCAFGDGLEGSLQYALEELLAKIFRLGREHGMNTAKENLAGNLRTTFDHMAKKAGLHVPPRD